MPSVSKKQHNLMAAVAHSPAFAKKVGIKQSVGKDFTAADKGKSFKEGGNMKTGKNIGDTSAKMPAPKDMGTLGLKKGGSVKAEGMKKDLAQDKKMVKKAVGMHDKQMHGGKKTDLASLKKGGCTKMAKGGGIEVRGKTRGKMC